MEIAPQILTAKVMHKRLFPKENQFTYGVYYLALPLEDIDSLTLSGVHGFRPHDHGARDGGNLREWMMQILQERGLEQLVTHITLITMPRILGYAFNPVSFWLCRDAQGQLRAMLYEVNNTFGETHSYLCFHEDHRVIAADDWMLAEKVFHVSPFLKREGHYRFRVALQGDQFGIWIDYADAEGRCELFTALTGTLEPLSKTSLRRAFCRHPFVTLKVITLIHWQAMKLMRKGIRYICKPIQLEPRRTQSSDLTKM